MNFSHALDVLKQGHKVGRAGWNGTGMWIAFPVCVAKTLQVPDVHSKMGLPYLYMKTVQGPLVPWVASQTDVLADDWNVVP